LADSKLFNALKRLRRRLLVLAGLSGLGWGAIASVAFLFLAAWVDLVVDLPSGMRLALLIAASGVGVFLLAKAVVAVFRRAFPLALARKLDDAGTTRGQISAGVDLASESGHRSGVGAGLAALAVQRAAELADRASPAKAAPSRPLWRIAFCGFGFAAFLVILGLFMPRLVGTQWLRFTDPFGDHPPYSRVEIVVEPGDAKVVYGGNLEVVALTKGPEVQEVELVLISQGNQAEPLPMFPEPGGKWRTSITNVSQPGKYLVRCEEGRSRGFAIEVLTVPKINEVRFRVTPPAYTRETAYEGPLPEGGLRGLPGTRVEVWAASNRPLSGGRLTTNDPKRLDHKLAPTGPSSKEASGSFEITATGRFELSVTDEAGQESTDRYTGTMTVLADQKPFVRLLEPQESSFAVADVTLPVVVAAEDDYGIARLQLFRSLNGSAPTPVELETGGEEPRQWSDGLPFPLSEYGLEPGDELKFFARVEDNDPAGAKGAESPVATVRIISREEYQKMLLAQQGLEVLMSKYDEAQRRMEKLSQEVEKLKNDLAAQPADSPLSEDQQRQLERLKRQMESEAEAIRNLAKEALPFDIDKALSEELNKLADQTQSAGQQTQSLAETPGLQSQQAAEELEKIAEMLAGAHDKYDENAQQPLEHLEKLFPLIEDEQRFAELHRRQQDLADRLSSLKGQENPDDPSVKLRMRDLESEQQALQDELEDLTADIEDHAAQLPEDPQLDRLRESAKAFADAVRQSGASQKMGDAQASLSEFAGPPAHQNAQDAADALKNLMSQCNGMGQGACEGMSFSPQLAQSLGNSLEQLLEAMGKGGVKPGQQGQGSNPGNGTTGPSGGGSMASRGGLNRMGLYGPLGSRPRASRQSGRGQSTAGGPGLDGLAGLEGITPPGAARTPDDPSASGAASPVVPLQYRGRVARYFEKIAEENP
jgi:hypothetical protein